MEIQREKQRGTGNLPYETAPLAPGADLLSAAPLKFGAAPPPDSIPPSKLLLTVRDCADRMAVSEKTVLRLLQRGKLRSLASIRHKRIPASELDRFIRDNLT